MWLCDRNRQELDHQEAQDIMEASGGRRRSDGLNITGTFTLNRLVTAEWRMEERIHHILQERIRGSIYVTTETLTGSGSMTADVQEWRR